MQTEMMLRLLRNDPTRKSGYRVVGYMAITAFGCYDGDYAEGCCHKIDGDGDILYDAFDLGIKVGKKWWFEGDIFLDPLHGKRHQIIYDAEKACWMEICEDYSEPLELFTWLLERAVRMERIGNIHEARTMEGE